MGRSLLRLAVLLLPGLAPAWGWGGVESLVEPEGHSLPPRGVLVGEARQDLVAALPGAETVIRFYLDVHGNRTREYLLEGLPFQVEWIPVAGPVVNYFDEDADGAFETMTRGISMEVLIPSWVLFGE